MSRKHYVKLAEIIKTNLDGANTNRTADEAVRAMAFDLANFCAEDNQNFDADRFLRAAGVR